MGQLLLRRRRRRRRRLVVMRSPDGQGRVVLMIEFERVPAAPGSEAKYEYHAVVPFVGGVVIRKEATTHAYPRGASNPRWFTYVEGERKPGSAGTLAEAQQRVRSM